MRFGRKGRYCAALVLCLSNQLSANASEESNPALLRVMLQGESAPALRQLVIGLKEVDRELSANLGQESAAVVNHTLAIATGETSGRVVVELVKDEGNIPTGASS